MLLARYTNWNRPCSALWRRLRLQRVKMRNDSVTVTLSGGSSYSAVDGASNPVSLTDNGDGSYTVTMPAADVTISAN